MLPVEPSLTGLHLDDNDDDYDDVHGDEGTTDEPSHPRDETVQSLTPNTGSSASRPHFLLCFVLFL